jgi:hypothetical protein
VSTTMQHGNACMSEKRQAMVRLRRWCSLQILLEMQRFEVFPLSVGLGGVLGADNVTQKQS